MQALNDLKRYADHICKGSLAFLGGRLLSCHHGIGYGQDGECPRFSEGSVRVESSCLHLHCENSHIGELESVMLFLFRLIEKIRCEDISYMVRKIFLLRIEDCLDQKTKV